jgi:hypothetical protein
MLLGLLGADGQVGDEHIGARGAQGLGHVDRLGRRLLALLGVELAEPVEGRAALHEDAQLSHVRQADRVVAAGVAGLGHVDADLGRVHVERRHHLDVAHVVPAQLDVHEAGDRVGGIGIAVVLDALHQRAGAVADAGDGEADGAHVGDPSWERARIVTWSCCVA